MTKTNRKTRADGTGCVYQRRRKDGSPSGWWIKFYRHGEQIVRNAHTMDQAEAKDQLAKLVGEIAAGVPIPRRQLTLEGAAKHVGRVATNRTGVVKTNYTYEKHLIPFFGRHTTMSAIDPIAIEKYKEARLKAGAAPATVNRDLEALRRAFTLAVQHGLLTSRPHIEKLAENNIRTGFFEPEQFEALLAHLNEVQSGKARPIAHVVRFAYITGWRLGEILGLRWKNVDLKAGTVRLEPGTTKNKEGRTFPLNADLRQLLDERREEQRRANHRNKVVALTNDGEAYVFTKKNGRPITTFRKRWHSAVRAIGVPDRVVKKKLANGKVVERRLPGLLVHDFRRTAVRRLERAGVARSVAMKLVGHKTESVYRRYAIVSESDLREAVEKVGAISGRTGS